MKKYPNPFNKYPLCETVAIIGWLTSGNDVEKMLRNPKAFMTLR